MTTSPCETRRRAPTGGAGSPRDPRVAAFAGPDEARRRLGELPAGLDVDYYPAGGEATPPRSRTSSCTCCRTCGPARSGWSRRCRGSGPCRRSRPGWTTLRRTSPAGVTLCNAAGVHDASTAELAVALVLASGRHLDVFARQQAESRWRRIHGTALADRRVLIFGYGTSGRRSRRGSGLRGRLDHPRRPPGSGGAGRAQQRRAPGPARRDRRPRGHRPADARDRGRDRRGGVEPPAGRGARGPRRPGPARRHRRPARRDNSGRP